MLFRSHVYTPHDSQHVLYRDPAKDHFNRATMVPLWEIGTDPLMATNAFQYVSTGKFEGDPVSGRFGPELRAREHTFDTVGHVVILSLDEIKWEILLQLLRPSNMMKMRTHIINRGMLIKSPQMHYKARPLNGIWATAPYLHNGAVPNLRQMLNPDERIESFCVGSIDFDAVNVGYDIRLEKSECEDREWSWFDTNIKGNTNIGHFKTVGLTESEKEALLVFLKTL